MKMITAKDVRTRFAEISDAVQQRKVSYIVTKHGKPTVRISPIEGTSEASISPKLNKELLSVFTRYDAALKELAKR